MTESSAMGRVMTGGEAIVAALEANGVDTVFGLPGAQTYALFDALHQSQDRIRTVGARHEQGCGYMAFGYARSTGRPGVFTVVPGPGVLNTTAALCTAWGCNTPVVCITGQIPSALLGRRRGALHELPDQLATLRSLVKWAERIERPADAPAVINEAFRQALSGRPGPVAVEMPWDMMLKREHVRPLAGAAPMPPQPPQPDEIEAAAQMLLGAKRVLIMTGSGAQHAATAIRDLAETLDAPVAAFRGGRGILAEDHELGISSYTAFRLLPETDVLIGIGTRLEMPFMRWQGGGMALIDQPQAPPFVIRIDIDPAEMRRLKVHGPIVADAADGAASLAAAVRRLGRPAGGRDHIAREKAAAAVAIRKVQPQMAYLDVIREVLPRDGFFVPELSQMGFTSYFGFDVQEPRTYVSEGFQGTLGFGFPTALGVKIANPGRAVVSVTGDGGFLFAANELATAVQERIGVVTLVFNNGGYGNVRRDQQTRFGGRTIGSDLTNPDFIQLGAAFGVDATRVATPDELRPVLAQAIANDRAALIEVTSEPGGDTSPWEFIHPVR